MDLDPDLGVVVLAPVVIHACNSHFGTLKTFFVVVKLKLFFQHTGNVDYFEMFILLLGCRSAS